MSVNNKDVGIYISNADTNTEDKDLWGVVIAWNDSTTIGAEYNLCYEQGTNKSAFYLMTREDNDNEFDNFNIETYYYKFIHYEIDFSNPNWEMELKEKALECVEIFEKETLNNK